MGASERLSYMGTADWGATPLCGQHVRMMLEVSHDTASNALIAAFMCDRLRGSFGTSTAGMTSRRARRAYPGDTIAQVTARDKGRLVCAIGLVKSHRMTDEGRRSVAVRRLGTSTDFAAQEVSWTGCAKRLSPGKAVGNLTGVKGQRELINRICSRGRGTMTRLGSTACFTRSYLRGQQRLRFRCRGADPKSTATGSRCVG